MLVNYGYMDQIVVFKWVQCNIVNFGGDLVNVMFFGEFVGGELVYNLLILLQVLGLFVKVIVEFGNGCVNQYFGCMFLCNVKIVGVFVEEQGFVFVVGFGIIGSDVCFLYVLCVFLVDQVFDGLDIMMLNIVYSFVMFFGSFIIDGKFVVDEFENQYKVGQFVKVLFLFGVNNVDFGFVMCGFMIKEQVYVIFGQ